MQHNESNIALIKDSEWSVIDGEPCRVIDFVPLGSTVKDGKAVAMDKTTPYASIVLECKKFPKNVTGYICHKMDFEHLWAAFKERAAKQDEEVMIFWSKRHYKSYAKLFSFSMPRLWVMICPKGAYNLIIDRNFKPELQGEARARATLPIVQWKPEVMK